MCDRYETELEEGEVAQLVERYKRVGRRHSQPLDVGPNNQAPVIVSNEDGRILRDMLWGFPALRGQYPYLTTFHMPNRKIWRAWLDKRYRCVVPATAFAEPDKNTAKPVQWRWFRRPDSSLFFFAGLWRPWTGERGTTVNPNFGNHLLYAIMTTAPNGIVLPVHERTMPVLLRTSEDIEIWLEGTVDEALALQKPAPNDVIAASSSFSIPLLSQPGSL